ncbi:MAG: tRNA pseudouridine(13) synthase TruD [Candidatus Nitrosotenuis sp.]
MIPKIDSEIGILSYTTEFSGCGGKIRTKLEDFVVSEILNKKTYDSLSSQDGYAVYKLRKTGIDTTHALDVLFRKTGVRLKALGLKDASAITEQYVCALAQNKSLQNYSEGKVSIEKIGFAKKPLTAKDMIGNNFVIRIDGASKDLASFSESDKILNFYGYQRFGSKRPVTHLIGKAIIQKRFADAVNLILSYTSEYDSQQNTKLRQEMTDPANYSKILPMIPQQMDLERIILHEMISHGDPKKALHQIPLGIRRLYVEAYQSFLFNLTLSNAYQYDDNLFNPQQGDVCFDKNAKLGKYEMDKTQKLAIPTVGYSYFKKTRFDYYISKILEQEQIKPSDFYLKEMQELSNEGGFRSASVTCTDFSIKSDVVIFSLQRGSFATMVMREIMKPQNPLQAGF